MGQDSAAVHGLQIHYTVEGTGPDVLFVHGWASSRRMWSHLTQELSTRYRCWSVDLPGFGDSDKPGLSWYSLSSFSATLRDFALGHGLRPLRVVGHSMGGMIALHFAAHHPELVAQLVALNPVVTGRAALRPLARPATGRRLLGWVLRVSPFVLQPLWSPALAERAWPLHTMRRRTQDFTRCTADSLFFSGRAVVANDLSPLLPRIAAPTLVIVGSRDRQVPASEGRLAAGHIPSARLHELRAGHMVTDDRPREVVHALQRFLH